MYAFTLASISSFIFVISSSELSRLKSETIACALAGRSTRESSSRCKFFRRLGKLDFLLNSTSTYRERSEFTRFDHIPDGIIEYFVSDNPSFTIRLDTKSITNFFSDRKRVDNYANLISNVHSLADPHMLHKFINGFYQCA